RHFSTKVGHTHAAWHGPATGEMADEANDDGEPELDMLAIAAPLHIDILYSDADLAALAEAQAHTFVDDAAIAHGLMQRVGQHVGRCDHIVDEAELAQLAIAGKVKAKQLVVQRVRGELQKPDLTLHRNARRSVIDLCEGQSGALKERF